MKYKNLLCLLVVMLLSLTGCADHTVRLLYRQAPDTAVLSADAPHVEVQLFADQRKDAWIGVRMGKNGGNFQAGSSVPEWVTQTLVDELILQGVRAEYSNGRTPLPAHADYTVTGEILQLWLTEYYPTQYQVELQIAIHMAMPDGSNWTEKFMVTQEKTGMPGSKLAESLLNEAMRSAASSASAKIRELLAR